MKKALIAALCAVASIAFVGVAGAGDLCYRFHSVTNNNNPYPTDSFRINYGSGRAIGTWVICVNGTGPYCSGGHNDVIVMSGAVQKNYPNSDFRVSLTGTVADQIFNNDSESGFARDCHVDAQLDNQARGDGPVYAWCEEYFAPDNPFLNLIELSLVGCGTVPNIATPQTTPFLQ